MQGKVPGKVTSARVLHEEPRFETLGSYRYAIRKPATEALAQKLRLMQRELGHLLVLWVLTWLALIWMVRLALHGFLSFELILWFALVVVLGSHGVHSVRVFRLG